MSLKDRIIQAKKYAKFNTNVELAAEVSKVIGREIPPQSIQSLVGPKADFKGSKLTPFIAMVCGVDAIWLATGEGDMVTGASEKRAHYGPLRKMAEQMLKNQEILLGMIDALDPGSPEYAKIIAAIEKRKKLKPGKGKK